MITYSRVWLNQLEGSLDFQTKNLGLIAGMNKTQINPLTPNSL
jgi:hypothetical protein